MKLARKLTLALLSVIVAVLAVHAAERVQQDERLIRADIRRDHRTLARALRAVVADVWREDGEQRALSVVAAANEQESSIRIRWVWPDVKGKQGPRVPHINRTRLRQGLDSEVLLKEGRHSALLTYVPVRLHDGRLGVLELGESLASEDEQIRATIWRTVLSTGLIALLTALITGWLGVWFVGRPVAQLMAKARRVGAGDLSGPLHFSQRDELADLAQEMNAMCERLDSESRARQLALEQLRHADRLGTVGRLAAGVAHELGTPLNVVGIEAARIAKGRAQGEQACEGARVIEEQARRMTTIISQLLDFARRRTLKRAPGALSELAQQTVSLLSALAARQQVTLRFERLADAHVPMDTGQIQQALTNLVVNAVQASQNGREVCVETGVGPARRFADSDSQEMAFIRVTDQGSGIRPEDVPRVFEPFFTTKDVGQGTGLGLAVAHGIVEEHGGFLEVSSELGQGSVFTIHLPLEVA